MQSMIGCVLLCVQNQKIWRKMMIGQMKIKSDIESLIANNKFPRFVILVGNRGSGKKLMAEWIAKKLKAQFVLSETKAEDVREIVEQSYKNAIDVLYTLPDAQNMSSVGQNAMLKVTEEPPNKAYFIMTVENESQILNTLISRGTLFRMDNYSTNEIKEYAIKYNTKDINFDMCETPGDVDLLMQNDPKEFNDYVSLVIGNIAEVSGSNSFKIGNKLNLDGKSEDKFDLVLFWKAFMMKCLEEVKKSPLKYASGVRITSRYLQDLRINGINKQMCFDNWLLDIRADWMEYADN